MTKRKRVPALLALTAIAGALSLGAVAAPARAAVRHIDGTVLSKDANAKTFRISTQSGSRVRIKVNASTRFERIAGGLSGLRKGMEVEVDAVRTSDGLLAKQVEPRGGGGGGHDDSGGSGGGGSDDGPSHT